MILRHITIKCHNTIKEIINHLETIDNGIVDLYVNSAYVNKENEITLEIDEKQIDEILKLTTK